MPRLSLRALPSLAADVVPPFDPAALRQGILHLGIGAFHRAHQAVFTQEAVSMAGGEWGICGATQRSGRVRDQLMPQDGLYSVLIRGAERSTIAVIGAVRGVLSGAEQQDAIVARIAAPSTHVVTLTVTEKGYRHDPATRELRSDDPELAADLAGRAPHTTIGQLVAGLAARRRADAGPLSVVCCDNLPDNGALVASLIGQFAQRMPGAPSLLEWIEANARFPSTMVDRIVPATTPADREQAAAALGARDEGLVVCEPFRQWVIADDFAGPRPAWEQAGALLTDDVRPYERAKVRLLNGSHSTLAYLGQLAGYELVSDVMAAGSPIEAVVRGLMSEDVVPTLEPVPGLDLAAYQSDLLTRFANPALAHRTAQIAMDGSQKLPQRLLGTIADRRRSGHEPTAAVLAVAAWIRCVVDRVADDGSPLTVDDPLAGRIAQAAAPGTAAAAAVDAMLGLREVFGDTLADDRLVRDLLVGDLQRLRRDGAENAARHLAGGL